MRTCQETNLDAFSPVADSISRGSGGGADSVSRGGGGGAERAAAAEVRERMVSSLGATIGPSSVRARLGISWPMVPTGSESQPPSAHIASTHAASAPPHTYPSTIALIFKRPSLPLPVPHAPAPLSAAQWRPPHAASPSARPPHQISVSFTTEALQRVAASLPHAATSTTTTHATITAAANNLSNHLRQQVLNLLAEAAGAKAAKSTRPLPPGSRAVGDAALAKPPGRAAAVQLHGTGANTSFKFTLQQAACAAAAAAARPLQPAAAAACASAGPPLLGAVAPRVAAAAEAPPAGRGVGGGGGSGPVARLSH